MALRKNYDLALNHLQQAQNFAPGSYNVKNAMARNYLKQSYDDKNLVRADASEERRGSSHGEMSVRRGVDSGPS